MRQVNDDAPAPRRRVLAWWAVYGLLCLAEFAVQQAKAWVAKKAWPA